MTVAEPATGMPRLVEWSNQHHPDPRLRFFIAIPEGHQAGPLLGDTPVPDRALVDLARIATDEVEIVVQASAMQHESALRDYYRLWARNGREKLLDLSLTDDNPDRPVLRVSNKLPDGQTWITWRTGFKVWQGYAAWVLTANVACEASTLAQNAGLMRAIVNSFRPAESLEHGLAETLRLVTRNQPVDFASYLPISWKEQPHNHDQPGPARFAFLRELRGETTGAFSIVAADKESFPECGDFIREAVSTWQPLGIDAGKITFDPAASLGNAPTRRGTLALPSADGQVADASSLEILLADFGSHWFHAEVFGPSAEQDFEAWAINHRALDLFARNFRTV